MKVTEVVDLDGKGVAEDALNNADALCDVLVGGDQDADHLLAGQVLVHGHRRLLGLATERDLLELCKDCRDLRGIVAGEHGEEVDGVATLAYPAVRHTCGLRWRAIVHRLTHLANGRSGRHAI